MTLHRQSSLPFIMMNFLTDENDVILMSQMLWLHDVLNNFLRQTNRFDIVRF